MEENQEIEVAGGTNDGGAGEQSLDLFQAAMIAGTAVAHNPIPIRRHGTFAGKHNGCHECLVRHSGWFRATFRRTHFPLLPWLFSFPSPQAWH